jgi:AcrR family transcriptional regulator
MNIHSYLRENPDGQQRNPKKEITAQRQEQILKAAMNVFGRKGYAGATVPEIAREAGVAAVQFIYIIRET